MKKMIWLVVVFAVATWSASAWAQGKTYKPDDEGFIRNWLLLDAIPLNADVGAHDEDSEKEFFDKEFFKGQFVATPKEGDKVKAEGDTYTWQAKEADDSALNFDEVDNAIYLGVAYIVADKDITGVYLSIGSDDSSLWRLNGKEIKGLRVYAGRGVEKDQNKSEEPLTLKAGVNVLSFAVINGGGPTGAVARFLDKSDNPITSFKVSITPPEKK